MASYHVPGIILGALRGHLGVPLAVAAGGSQSHSATAAATFHGRCEDHVRAPPGPQGERSGRDAPPGRCSRPDGGVQDWDFPPCARTPDLPSGASLSRSEAALATHSPACASSGARAGPLGGTVEQGFRGSRSGSCFLDGVSVLLYVLDARRSAGALFMAWARCVDGFGGTRWHCLPPCGVKFSKCEVVEIFTASSLGLWDRIQYNPSAPF